MNILPVLKKGRWCMPIVLAVVLTACQSDESTVPAPSSVSVPESMPQTESVPEETVQQPAYTAPLTGLEVEQPDRARPIAVMINNAPAARPQSGLSEADMVYEVLAEGGITRLIAVYQSYHGDATIGPVRSIRPYLIGIGDSLHALLVHAGGSTDAYAILQGGGREHLDEITNASAPFWRDSSRKAPHNLYTNETKLREAAAKKGYTETVDIPAFPFLNVSSKENANTPAASTESARQIELRFLLKSYQVGYRYDSAAGLYTRQINGKDHIDLNNNKPLTAANVIVLAGSYKVLDDIGRLSLNLNAGGEALLFQQGKVIRGEWKHGQDDAIRFYSQGQEVPLLAGTTYYNIVPDTPSFYEHLTIDGEKWD